MIAACWLSLAYVLSVEYSKSLANAGLQGDNLAPSYAAIGAEQHIDLAG